MKGRTVPKMKTAPKGWVYVPMDNQEVAILRPQTALVIIPRLEGGVEHSSIYVGAEDWVGKPVILLSTWTVLEAVEALNEETP